MSTLINKPQAHIVDNPDDVIAIVVFEVNLVENNTEWIVDIGATKHFYTNKEMFAKFEKVTEGKQVHMGNLSISEILAKGKLLLKLTSGKTLALNNVLYVPSLYRNLIISGLLNKVGIKLVFESNKLVLSRNRDYVKNGYLCGGLFVIETMFNNNKVITFAYIVESFDMWYARIGNVNIHSLKKIVKMNLLPNLDNSSLTKCEICVEVKHARPSLNPITNGKTELLELVHTDLADFRNMVIDNDEVSSKVSMPLRWVKQPFHGSLLNRLVLLTPRWSQIL
ncbi:hypothetical protein J1N35_022740 [Gossypium stocksii]|uniref:GAG-pre-integrase domain-containing protein n=1 Tax=Gossypium stocksii TaxID=47602 RepID=A0A9D3VIG3_9ROSI|nr:hypothetical protein J1N35_022740 [Gossypium stocksii]